MNTIKRYAKEVIEVQQNYGVYFYLCIMSLFRKFTALLQTRYTIYAKMIILQALKIPSFVNPVSSVHKT